MATYRLDGIRWEREVSSSAFIRTDGAWCITVEYLSAQHIAVAYFHHVKKGMCGEMVIARDVVLPATNSEIIAMLEKANLAFDGFAAAVDLVFPDQFSRKLRGDKRDIVYAANKVIARSAFYKDMPPLLAKAIEHLAFLIGKGEAA